MTSKEEATVAVQQFLAHVVDVSERIENAIQRKHTHGDPGADIDALYDERRAAFANAEGFLAKWIAAVPLAPSDSWQLYKNFLLALEEEHVKRQYQVENQALGFDDIKIEDNPFLIQEDEVDDRNKVDEMIDKRRLTRDELLGLMGNLDVRELGALMRLARNLTEGNIWERKYDL